VNLPLDWSLQDPQLLWLGLLLPLALAWRLWRRPPAKAFAAYRFVPHLGRSARQRSRALPLLLELAALSLMVLAIARPQERMRLPVEEQAIDLLLSVDLSSSMAATDLDPARPDLSRLGVAREAASRFIARRPGDRLGLLSFARDAELRCPPTFDHRSLLGLLDDLEQVPAGREDDATGIGVALARAAVHLRDAPSASRVVVLLTDGEETVAAEAGSAGIRPMQAATLCRDWGIRVHVIAAGPEASAAQASLRAWAGVTGGLAFAARDAAALEQVYEAIDTLERTRFERLPWRQVDRFLPFLVAAALLWILAAALRRGLWEVRS
jgi:Ca-activated chloride channel family protein